MPCKDPVLLQSRKVILEILYFFKTDLELPVRIHKLRILTTLIKLFNLLKIKGRIFLKKNE